LSLNWVWFFPWFVHYFIAPAIRLTRQLDEEARICGEVLIQSLRLMEIFQAGEERIFKTRENFLTDRFTFQVIQYLSNLVRVEALQVVLRRKRTVQTRNSDFHIDPLTIL